MDGPDDSDGHLLDFLDPYTGFWEANVSRFEQQLMLSKRVGGEQQM